MKLALIRTAQMFHKFKINFQGVPSVLAPSQRYKNLIIKYATSNIIAVAAVLPAYMIVLNWTNETKIRKIKHHLVKHLR